MMLGRVGTSRLVTAKFGKGKGLNKAYLFHLCEIHMLNEKRLYNMVLTRRPVDTAREIIKHMVEEEVIFPTKHQRMNASIGGIISGVGGHVYYQPILDTVTQMVQKERDRRIKEGAL